MSASGCIISVLLYCRMAVYTPEAYFSGTNLLLAVLSDFLCTACFAPFQIELRHRCGVWTWGSTYRYIGNMEKLRFSRCCLFQRWRSINSAVEFMLKLLKRCANLQFSKVLAETFPQWCSTFRKICPTAVMLESNDLTSVTRHVQVQWAESRFIFGRCIWFPRGC